MSDNQIPTTADARARWGCDQMDQELDNHMADIKTTKRPANDEMVEGFLDGYDLSAPEPSSNRSHSYRHGFANGRDDRAGRPRASHDELVRMASLAMELDDSIQGAGSHG